MQPWWDIFQKQDKNLDDSNPLTVILFQISINIVFDDTTLGDLSAY